MFEVQFRGEDPAGAVGELDRQGPAQGSEADRGFGERGDQPEALAGWGVDPVAEPCVADVEGEPAQQGRLVLGVGVEGVRGVRRHGRRVR
jgi:hypothetical protein